MTKREEAIMQEAFMIGRIYNKMGEKESPIEIQNKLKEKCELAVKSETAKGGRVETDDIPKIEVWLLQEDSKEVKHLSRYFTNNKIIPRLNEKILCPDDEIEAEQLEIEYLEVVLTHYNIKNNIVDIYCERC